MRKKITILSGCILISGLTALSQSRSEEFNRFRQEVFANFDSFKSRILEHYDDFLNGEWHEFEPILEEPSPYTEPKPKELPIVKPEEIAKEKDQPPVKLPDLKMSPATLPEVEISTIKPEDLTFIHLDPVRHMPVEDGSKPIPSINTKPSEVKPDELSFIHLDPIRHMPVEEESKPISPIDTKPGEIKPGELESIPKVPIEIDEPTPENEPLAVENQNVFKFDFYGMQTSIPEIDFKILPSIAGHNETGKHWKMMADQEGGALTSQSLYNLAEDMGLNGYLTFRLTEQYVNQRFPSSNPSARMSAVHFLLSNMGYDVRLLQYNNFLTIMMPFDQKTVYSTSSLVENNKRKYTILFPESYEYKYGEKAAILTCRLPADAAGKTSDLRVTGLNLPHKGKSFKVGNERLTLYGEVNENIKKMFHHYPQMPNGDFASSWIDQSLRDNLVNQVREQLAGMSQKDAINTMMKCIHDGFPYKSDQDWHIFEKPYFVEENFLYDFNDCEDRAILMTYLVWNALGIPCQLIQYPGHESVTVAVDENGVSGCYYETDGRKYFSADPTYIGSHLGMVMSAYKQTSPTIDKHYK